MVGVLKDTLIDNTQPSSIIHKIQKWDCPLNVHNAMMIVNVIIVIGTDGTNTWTLEANS